MKSFYVPGTHWTVAALYRWSDEPEDGYWVSDYGANGRVFGITGDTIVSGIFYRKLGLSAYGSYGFNYTLNCRSGPCVSDSSYCYSYDPLLFEYVGRVRIDSNRVYFILDMTSTSFDYFTSGSYVQGQEYLLYDFNILPGGGFNSEVSYDSGYRVVTIDSVLLSNGKHVSRYTDSVGNYWIWGIGGTSGPFGSYRTWWCIYVDEPYPGPGNEYWDSYSLCYNNPSFSYQFSYADSLMLSGVQNSCFDVNLLPPCYDHQSNSQVQSLNSPTANSITIYPNPTTSTLTISVPDSITSIAITNLLGQVVYSQQYNSQQVQVDVADLPKGVYFIKVNGGDVRKFVKE